MRTSIEHLNVTLSDLQKSANLFCQLFDWKIRWRGDAIYGGQSMHVGSDTHYLALYAPKTSPDTKGNNYNMVGGMNHIGIIVDDLDEVEKRVIAAGLEPHSHADYEPGRRFYFKDHDNLEYEVVSYD